MTPARLQPARILLSLAALGTVLHAPAGQSAFSDAERAGLQAKP